ncbi:MAG TPA: ABC transporter permease subunit [Herpetosiphonaceae bacterium]|nr:ABC transporter permease subunit [Herpetosiphonaceae bacterium]
MKAILLKELRSYLRGARPFTLITVYLTILGGLLVLMYAGQSSSSFVNRAEIGLSLYATVIGLALLQLTFLAPALNASSLGSERDRQTIDLLMITPVSPLQLVIGKLAAPCLFLLIMSVATLPLAAFAFLIGGIELRDLAIGLGLLALTTLGYGTIGIWAAARSRTSRAGTMISQGISLGLAIGVPILSAFLVALLAEQQRQGSEVADWFLTSPIIRWPGLALLALSPFAGLFSWFYAIEEGGSLWSHTMPSELGGGSIPAIWLLSLLVWGVVIPLVLWRSARTLPRSVARQGGG